VDALIEVGVVGSGTAGAAAALLLARAGCTVTVLERVADPGPVGAGIVLQPTGQAVLARLGLAAEIAARAARIDRLWCRTPRGRSIVDLRYDAVDDGWFGLGVHRGVLFDALYRAARAEPRVEVRTGVEIVAIARDGARTGVVDAGGTEHGPFDLVVVADGAVSELRGAAGVTTRDAAYPWGALWFVGADAGLLFSGQLYQVAAGARRLYGVLPTGLGPHGGTPQVSLFWSLRGDQHDAWRAAGLAAWKREVAALDPRARHLLDQIDDADQLVFARYRDVRMRRCHDRGVVFIGDAAHATSPQLGQGANLALLDALALAEAVAAQPAVDDALAAYARGRRRHLAYYQRMTRWLTPFFQSRARVLGWLRDVAFPLGMRLPPVRRFMVRTMAGVERGWLRRPLALPAASAPAPADGAPAPVVPPAIETGPPGE
jgi:2-polyprenyl-6-methoxyphenol hydroxylase-like FAD-dependent oxidoreductase